MAGDADDKDQPGDRFFLGLDLGQSQDFSALVALRRRDVAGRKHYLTRGIKRWPLRTPYPVIVADVVQLTYAPPLAHCVLGIDRTGCGQPVVDMVRAAQPQANIRPIFISGGRQVTKEGVGFIVPKTELVSAVSVALQTDRLAIPSTLPEAETLGKELLAFRAKISAKGTESLEADWRLRAHDDLVLALAIAVWLSEREQPLLMRMMSAGDDDDDDDVATPEWVRKRRPIPPDIAARLGRLAR